MFMIRSVACCKLPSPSFWIAKRCTLLRKYASLTWKQGNKKGIQWAKRTLDGVDAKVKKKF